MKKPIYKRWWFIAIIVIVVIGIIGGMSGSKEGPKKEESKPTVEQIVKDSFPDSKVTVEYNKDNKDLFLSVEAPDHASESAAFNVEGGRLARCIKDVQKEYPDTNWQSVDIGCKSFPSVITCQFNADAVKNYKDWENFSQKDIEKLCDAYSDCRK